MSEKAVEGYLAAFQNAMWPDGNRRPPSAPRTKQEKSRTKAKVELKFETLVPGQSEHIHSMRVSDKNRQLTSLAW